VSCPSSATTKMTTDPLPFLPYQALIHAIVWAC
jgi:hypothetical protein